MIYSTKAGGFNKHLYGHRGEGLSQDKGGQGYACPHRWQQRLPVKARGALQLEEKGAWLALGYAFPNVQRSS